MLLKKGPPDIMDMAALEESIDALNHAGFEMIAIGGWLVGIKLTKSLKDGIENIGNIVVIFIENFSLIDENQVILQP